MKTTESIDPNSVPEAVHAVTSLSSIPQVETQHYTSEKYDDLPRLQSYVYQIHRTSELGISSAVEVGVGNGFTSDALRKRDIKMTTIDFDASLNPDIVASVTTIPLPDGYADAALCFEVLEHLPFDQFVPAIKELARVARKWVFISVPDSRPSIRFLIGRGWHGTNDKRWMISNIPGRKAPVHQFDGQHYWEVGKRDTEEKRVLATLEQTGLALVEHGRLFQNPYHHFFLLKNN